MSVKYIYFLVGIMIPVINLLQYSTIFVKLSPLLSIADKRQSNTVAGVRQSKTVAGVDKVSR